ncbi:UNKNOWN [Stylonychia lemnae]|uniref:Uncharacterized protein n=1 Tax=Stylonychia lemnae TaxID=5949 RepID=A0A078B5G4_STYLE|nr:UNKNOWN [Stylonychia lemnae]|eukprot:CDW88773.1 UNKNOWN [Stylonychia lemnae]
MSSQGQTQEESPMKQVPEYNFIRTLIQFQKLNIGCNKYFDKLKSLGFKKLRLTDTIPYCILPSSQKLSSTHSWKQYNQQFSSDDPDLQTDIQTFSAEKQKNVAENFTFEQFQASQVADLDWIESLNQDDFGVCLDPEREELINKIEEFKIEPLSLIRHSDPYKRMKLQEESQQEKYLKLINQDVVNKNGSNKLNQQNSQKQQTQIVKSNSLSQNTFINGKNERKREIKINQKLQKLKQVQENNLPQKLKKTKVAREDNNDQDSLEADDYSDNQSSSISEDDDELKVFNNNSSSILNAFPLKSIKSEFPVINRNLPMYQNRNRASLNYSQPSKLLTNNQSQAQSIQRPLNQFLPTQFNNLPEKKSGLLSSELPCSIQGNSRGIFDLFGGQNQNLINRLVPFSGHQSSSATHYRYQNNNQQFRQLPQPPPNNSFNIMQYNNTFKQSPQQMDHGFQRNVQQTVYEDSLQQQSDSDLEIVDQFQFEKSVPSKAVQQKPMIQQQFQSGLGFNVFSSSLRAQQEIRKHQQQFKQPHQWQKQQQFGRSRMVPTIQQPFRKQNLIPAKMAARTNLRFEETIEVDDHQEEVLQIQQQKQPNQRLRLC